MAQVDLIRREPILESEHHSRLRIPARLKELTLHTGKRYVRGSKVANLAAGSSQDQARIYSV